MHITCMSIVICAIQIDALVLRNEFQSYNGNKYQPSKIKSYRKPADRKEMLDRYEPLKHEKYRHQNPYIADHIKQANDRENHFAWRFDNQILEKPTEPYEKTDKLQVLRNMYQDLDMQINDRYLDKHRSSNDNALLKNDHMLNTPQLDRIVTMKLIEPTQLSSHSRSHPAMNSYQINPNIRTQNQVKIFDNGVPDRSYFSDFNDYNTKRFHVNLYDQRHKPLLDIHRQAELINSFPTHDATSKDLDGPRSTPEASTDQSDIDEIINKMNTKIANLELLNSQLEQALLDCRASKSTTMATSSTSSFSMEKDQTDTIITSTTATTKSNTTVTTTKTSTTNTSTFS